MKTYLKVITMSTIAVFLICGSAVALTTPINPLGGGNGSETNLTTVLDNIYGAGNYTRIDDLNDQVWKLCGDATQGPLHSSLNGQPINKSCLGLRQLVSVRHRF